MTPTPDYFIDNYGVCKVATCTCRKPGPWRGRLCPHWQPLGALTFGQLFDHALKTAAERRQGKEQ